MNRLCQYFKTSVGKKQLIALTGLGLSGFVLTHMLGNLLLFCGAQTYNSYSHQLLSNPLIEPIELGLAGLFIVHMFLAFSITRQNCLSRPIASKAKGAGLKDARFGSQWMILSGLVIGVFTGLHLWHFKYGTHYTANYNGVEIRDLYRLVMELLSQPLYLGWYLFAIAILGAHLSHGFSAVFQTFGFASVRAKWLLRLGYLFAAIISLGFMSQPILAYVRGGI